MTKERRLGRGLEALLGRTADMPATIAMRPDDGMTIDAVRPAPAARHDGLLKLSVMLIDANPFQPRLDFDDDETNQLAGSLKEHGLLQPLVVRSHGDRFQLVSGERRLRAALIAGWTHVPALLREADDRQLAELAIVENLQRKDLGALEKAVAFQQYLDRYQCPQDELARRLGLDRSTVANLIRLLELPQEVQEAVRLGRVSAGHARALLPLGDEREQLACCQRIASEGLSVRATEQLVHELIAHAEAPAVGLEGALTRKSGRARKTRVASSQLSALEQELRSALGAKVALKQTAAGRGRIVIHFANHDEFERLREHLRGTTKRAAG